MKYDSRLITPDHLAAHLEYACQNAKKDSYHAIMLFANKQEFKHSFASLTQSFEYYTAVSNHLAINMPKRGCDIVICKFDPVFFPQKDPSRFLEIFNAADMFMQRKLLRAGFASAALNSGDSFYVAPGNAGLVAELHPRQILTERKRIESKIAEVSFHVKTHKRGIDGVSIVSSSYYEPNSKRLRRLLSLHPHLFPYGGMIWAVSVGKDKVYANTAYDILRILREWYPVAANHRTKEILNRPRISVTAI